MISEKTKYQRWYDGLIAKARSRQIPKPNTEMHHILPRALGGSDDESNLVRLMYREHFVAHWLLTKLLSGKDLRKMQFALWAMTMCANGTRAVTGWQYEVARRAVYEPIQIAQARAEKWKQELLSRDIAQFHRDMDAVRAGERVDVNKFAERWAKYHRLTRSPEELAELDAQRATQRTRRRPRPSKRVRQRLKAKRESEGLVYSSY